MRYRTIHVSILLLTSQMLNAQYDCDVSNADQRSTDEDDFNEYVIDFEQQGLHLNTDIQCIPVVFHIINQPGFPISRVIDQLERTNQHLRRTHVDTVNTRSLFVPFATDSHIQLKLSTVDPNGMPFNGIDHVDVPNYTLSMTQSVIAANIYDPSSYMNVWVFPGISASGVFPWEAVATNDGIIVAPENVGFGLGGTDPNAQGGKVFTHELGHFLGLYHTFHGDAWTDPGNCDDLSCATTGDRCCDTPIDYRFFPLPGDMCTMDTLWCTQGENVIPDDENFMFYNLDQCQNMFTIDQRVRMRACLSGVRASLITPENHVATGIGCETTVSIQQPTDHSIAIFTDPTGSLLHVNASRVNKPMQLMLYDQAGRVVMERIVPAEDQIIDLSDLSPGIYQVILRFDQGVIQRKIMKH